MGQSVPVLSVVRTVLFPGMSCSLHVWSNRAAAALQVAVRAGGARSIAVFATQGDDDVDPQPEDLYEVGTLARVIDVAQRPCCGAAVAEIEGLERVRSVQYLRSQPFREVLCEGVEDPEDDTEIVRVTALAIRDAARQMRQLFPRCAHAADAVARLGAVGRPHLFTGAVASLLRHLPVAHRQALLEKKPLSARLEATLLELDVRLALFRGRAGSTETLLH